MRIKVYLPKSKSKGLYLLETLFDFSNFPLQSTELKVGFLVQKKMKERREVGRESTVRVSERERESNPFSLIFFYQLIIKIKGKAAGKIFDKCQYFDMH